MNRRSKYSTAITNYAQNEGLDSVKAIKKAQDIVLYCADTYEEAHMYSLVIVGSQSVADYRWAYNTLADKLRDFGFDIEFFGALEHAEDKGGLHCHVYYIIECVHANPAGVKRVSATGNTKVVKIMSTESDSWLKKTLAKRGMSFHISEPQNEVHRTRTGTMPMYARPTLRGGRLADCLVWSSYPYKVRSKAGAKAKTREIYFFSEFEANKAKRELKGNEIETVATAQSEASTSQSPASSTSEAMVCTGQPANGSEEAGSQGSPSPERYGSSRASPDYEDSEMKLTPAQRYVGMLYERAVDLGLDVDAVRRYLLEHGVVRTPGQVAYELEHIFCFYGYATSHQPRPEATVAELDKAIERGYSPAPY